MTKDQKQIEAQKAVIDALQETIAAQAQTNAAKYRALTALRALYDLKHREPLVWFTAEMEQTLRKNDYKGGWSKCKIDWLYKRLCDEVVELGRAVQERKGLHIIAEAADVANFAMMVADRVRE